MTAHINTHQLKTVAVVINISAAVFTNVQRIIEIKTYILQFVIVFSLFCVSGVLSADFQIFLPETIEAVAGSCVTIPCSFEIQDKYEKYLNDTCVAIWRKGNNWSSAQDVTSRFIIKATTGDLKNKICTSTMNNIQIADGGSYFFRVQCNNALKYTFYSSVNINVKADPPKPTLSPSELEVEEGASVSLQCSAPAPCPSLRPTVTWTPSLGTSQETLMDNQDKTKVIKSVLNFTASHLHHGQRFSCTAVYRREDNRNVSSVSQRLSAHVKYRPEDTKVSVSPSGPVQEGTNVVLKCSSDANPAVQIYTWYRADPQHETLIHTGPDLTITASRNTGAFLCQAENDLGTGRSNKTNIDVQYVQCMYHMFPNLYVHLLEFSASLTPTGQGRRPSSTVGVCSRFLPVEKMFFLNTVTKHLLLEDSDSVSVNWSLVLTTSKFKVS
uniref:Ig-like domain-containing protein n=1 Tax=Sphaeramia orbicularis TaxID=375764 RepID=A0A673A484_9TELE